MTVREREERGNSSNTKVAENKKQNVEEEEEDINLQIGASNSQNQIKKVRITEESKDGEESERSSKRSRIKESEEAESTINEEEEESDSSEVGKDPLLATEEIVMEYHDFIDYIYHQILKEDEQKWSEIVERGKLLVKTVNRSLRTVKLEMECIEAVEDFEKQYLFRKTHIPQILSLLRHINSRIESSTNFRLVSNIKNRRKVLPMCLRELETSKQELSEMIDVIQVLKELDLKSEDDDDDADDDDEEETE
ncbi:myelin transcription factor 1-like [Benincasa hispida]|uniref:myelin transcription factor 1-like n=1 Tax=Benincasa hispida TaxID=102211 RepID=UPI00190215B7|nr:myelin transcription factor 1-like [Benincasa hispida]